MPQHSVQPYSSEMGAMCRRSRKASFNIAEANALQPSPRSGNGSRPASKGSSPQKAPKPPTGRPPAAGGAPRRGAAAASGPAGSGKGGKGAGSNAKKDAGKKVVPKKAPAKREGQQMANKAKQVSRGSLCPPVKAMWMMLRHAVGMMGFQTACSALYICVHAGNSKVSQTPGLHWTWDCTLPCSQ
jgi:hypothetical protein